MKASFEEVNVKVGEGIYYRVTVGPVTISTPTLPFSAAAVLGALLIAGNLDASFGDMLLEKTGHIAEFDREHLVTIGEITLSFIPPKK